MSRLYNYFVTCWTTNSNFTETNLDNAVTKKYITQEEADLIKVMSRNV